MNTQNPVLWRPGNPQATRLAAFAKRAGATSGRDLGSYPDLHRWSVHEPEAFWQLWLHESEIDWNGQPEPAHDGGDPLTRRWFPAVTLSFAANLLRHAADERRADTEALVTIDERGERVGTSWRRLLNEVAGVRQRLAAQVGPGTRVAALLPNGRDALVGMLATVSLGGVWSSASPDFGEDAIVDRFGQIEPAVCFVCTGYTYGGRHHDIREKLQRVRRRLPGVQVWMGTRDTAPLPTWCEPIPGPVAVDAASELADWPRFPFDQPLYTMFSSGTTGVPKCIIHGAGGTLLQHSKEHQLHSDLRCADRILYFTTTGWMMWNWLVSALFTGATVVLFDGSPVTPDAARLWRVTREEGLTHLGVSPRFLAACRNAGVDARELTASLRVLFSTGAPLLPEDFDYVYERIAPHAQLASISGGTDIISCFMLGVPTLPVRRGEIQAAALGMDVVAADPRGRPLIAERGELVCRTPFPSRPLGFHGDDAGRSRYRAAYYERFPGWWTHGDYIEMTGSVGSAGGIIVYGRSDATLNPGGVRIGTAEIYRIVESMPEVEDSLAVGRPLRGDVEIVLFVRCTAAAEGLAREDLERRIRERLRSGASPRHVPRRILVVASIPYTRSGKKVELAVRDILAGRAPANRGALAKPEALDEYIAIAEREFGLSLRESR